MTNQEALAAAKFADERLQVESLLASTSLTQTDRQQIEESAVQLVERVRERKSEHSLLDTFLLEFGLENDEGVALMCLAEALLRVPDAQTADVLIADKIVPANWSEHIGDSDSVFVNASTWGLMLTGRVIGVQGNLDTGEWLSKLIGRLGEPVIRAAMRQAMELLGREFVLGQTMDSARARAAKLGYAHVSYDMLGEGARTQADADRHMALYSAAIADLASPATTPDGSTGVSVKLSALHPRYEFAQQQRVMKELYPRLLRLAELAAQHNVQLALDAEEADRVALSLDLLEQLAQADSLAGWNGLGYVVQSYSKRAVELVRQLIDLARSTSRRIQVRLVKGAYWDAEIKHAQVVGLPDFSVFTRKSNTDVAYLVCAEQLLAAPEQIYPQFATHNAHTLAAVMQLGTGREFEFQRLHGMGELLYRTAQDMFADFPRVRVYAPVGGHEDLLPYLVRRLLENGANSSFVNRFLDEATPAEEVVADPFRLCTAAQDHRHGAIRLPADLYGPGRVNSAGCDFADAGVTARLSAALGELRTHTWDPQLEGGGELQLLRNPADANDLVGRIRWSTREEVDDAFAAACTAQPAWEAAGRETRARVLRALADQLAAHHAELTSLLVREAGKTLPDADAEIREAVDFCRYYAQQVEHTFAPVALPGPTGEDNQLELSGRGVFVCISPWNFPLAIFLGQISAALAAGNGVVAKPAEQTPLIAEYLRGLLPHAGLPTGLVQLVHGASDVGAWLVDHPACGGVAFTGSTATAKRIQMALARRPGEILPLIAETGGQNVMIVDSSALLEQVADDVLASAFGSAGQRCSALRVLFVQEDITERALALIRGAMVELSIGDPGLLTTDVGPVIDVEALNELEAHVSRMRERGAPVFRVPCPGATQQGNFCAPTLIEISAMSELEQENFGPILHVIRYPAADLEGIIDQVAAAGYGLTLGIHSRIERHQMLVAQRAPVGNVYVNRNIVGAVVGVQPFGGRGLSGTGPKAGGPHYLQRFAAEKTLSINTTAQGGNIDLLREGGDLRLR